MSERLVYEFGSFRLDAADRVLTRDGEMVLMTPKAMETLLALLRRHGRLVSREELLREVWPDSFVEDGSLHTNIYLLRRLLGKGSDAQDYIVTVPRRGYRFVGQVREISEDARCDTAPDEHSIAVLPFSLFGADEPNEYLSLGLADAIITRLGNLSRLIVRPTSAISKFANQLPPPLAAAGELRVGFMLEGSVRRSGDRLRVTVQLVRAQDGATLWAANFDESFTDIFTVEDSISEQVVSALALKLSEDEKSAVA